MNYTVWYDMNHQYPYKLGSHHQQKKIRHWIHKDYYLINETESELVEWRAHIGKSLATIVRVCRENLKLTGPDHCMEMMRVSIMCKGDPSLSTFRWLPEDPTHVTAVAHGHHQCVDWDTLMAWVRERAVPIFEPGVLARLKEAEMFQSSSDIAT